MVHAEVPEENDVLRTLRPDLIGDRALTLEVKPWKALHGAFVALMYIGIPGGETVRTQRLHPTLAVVREEGGALSLVARVETEEPRCRELPPDQTELELNLDGGDCPAMHLDLAPYRISPTETALGLRTKTHEVFPAGESEAEKLTLFRILGHTLKPIFSAEMMYSDEQRGPGDLTTSESTLQVSEQKTSGYFDLVLVETTRSEKIFDTNYSRTKRTQRRFSWQGGRYVPTRR
ncbi:MAG: hypothetical protein JO068_21130 [Hyphomicrobiales bacterium]|nr:hypothetical protein [Hyphomicrobiales bacterium]MBV9520615.1 hypothetical protein [Hyphomicrobiales bacterium]